MRTVGRLLEETRSGGSAAVAVVGEPGIGKTRLLGELGQRSRSAGCTVLAGRASELEPDAPFGVVVEALDDAIGGLGPAVWEQLGRERLAELSLVFPSLAGVGRRPADALDVERYRSHYAVRAALGELARSRPLVLVLDDVHWADPASVELVSYLLRQPVTGMLLALGHRLPAADALARVADRAIRERSLRLIELGPLSRDEAAAMLEGVVLPPAVDALYAETGGNPFYLEQLARASSRADLVLPAGARPSPSDASVPAAVRTAIAQELSRLSPLVQRLAHAAAVAGDPFDVDLAREIADLDEPAAWAGVDELVAAAVVEPTEVPGRLLFRHPIMRRAVYDAAGHGWRVRAHRRAAGALAEREAPLGVQAHHVVRSAVSVGDEQAIELLVEASRAAAPRAPATAAHWLGAAERLLPPDADPGRRLGLQVALATSLATLGRLYESRAVLQRALGSLPPGGTAERVQLTAFLARVEHHLGDAETSRRLIEDALAASRPASPEAAALTLELAKNHSMRQEWDLAAHAAREALDAAQRLGDREVVIAAEAASAFFGALRLGMPEVGEEETAGARRCCAAAAAGVDHVPDAELTPALLETLVFLGQVEMVFEQWDAAETHLRRGIRVCRATGQGERLIWFNAVLAAVLTLRGNPDEASQTAEGVAEALRLVENHATFILNESMRCWSATVLGETTRALEAGTGAVAAAERTPHAQFAWVAHLCHGEALVEAGHHAEGRARILMAGGPDLSDVAPLSRSRWLRVLADAELGCELVDEAEATATRARSIAERVDLPMVSADAFHAAAAVLLAQGRIDEALDQARRAVADYQAAATPIDAARATMLVGLAHQQQGDTAQAIDALEAAHAELQRRGAVRLADRAAHHLRQHGRRVSRRAAPDRPAPRGLASLSRREREVAALLTAGRTTRQAADELYLSPKTVETHLANIYSKLGISSRLALARALDTATAEGP
jgi:ATP/maltotriose-dependent transcriptional regulator MalT